MNLIHVLLTHRNSGKLRKTGIRRTGELELADFGDLLLFFLSPHLPSPPLTSPLLTSPLLTRLQYSTSSLRNELTLHRKHVFDRSHEPVLDRDRFGLLLVRPGERLHREDQR